MPCYKFAFIAHFNGKHLSIIVNLPYNTNCFLDGYQSNRSIIAKQDPHALSECRQMSQKRFQQHGVSCL